MHKLQILQNDMLRLITGHRRSDRINMERLRKKTNMMSINQLSCYHVLLESHNVLVNNSSEQLKAKMLTTRDHVHDLRSGRRGDIKIPPRPSRSCNRFSYTGARAWNQLPKQIRETSLSEPFKRKMKKWILETIPS